jgi:hypothetical protein
VAREPFVWEVHVRREVLEDEVARLREVPYTVWREAIGVPRVKSITGRDDREYALTVTAEFDRGDTQNIRVTVTLGGSGLRHPPLQQAFAISPDDLFLEA